MKFSKILKKVKKVSKEDYRSSIAKVAKISEEAGELSAEILKYYSYKGTNKSKSKLRKDIISEGADVISVVLNILAEFDVDSKEIEKNIQKKLKFWHKKNKKMVDKKSKK